MSYLFNELKPQGKYHFWDGAAQDTGCNLWSTGGIKQTRKGWTVVAEKPARELCHMCSEKQKQEMHLLKK